MSTTALMRKQIFINNKWRDAASGKTLEVINPATEEVVATVPSADRADVDAAVAAARAGNRPPVSGAREWCQWLVAKGLRASGC